MRLYATLVLVFMAIAAIPAAAQKAVLRDVKIIQVMPTVVANPEKVKDENGARMVEESLASALKASNFEVGEAPVKAHIVLDEFSGGSTAKRVLIGMGAGRSTVEGRLVFQDAQGQELASVKIRVRGKVLFSPYQGDSRQKRQAVEGFDKKLMEEIAKLK